MKKNILLFSSLLIIFSLNACQGGSSSDDLQNTQNSQELYAPIANAGEDKVINDGDSINLNASASSDSDGNIVGYEWKEGSVVLSTEKTFEYNQYISTGIHTITLTVTDNDGNTDTDEVKITVSEVLEITEITHKGIGYNTVISPYTGKKWLDRNLGATRACKAFNDEQCYGDYYQWGRNTDGHEKITSSKTETLASSISSPGSTFIEVPVLSRIYDWVSVDIDTDGSLRSLNWSKTDGSSICPAGFRVPSIEELEAETIDIGLQNNIDAYEHFMKLPSSGYRNGSLQFKNSRVYLASTYSDTSNYGRSRYLDIGINWAQISMNELNDGLPVRCIYSTNESPSENAEDERTTYKTIYDIENKTFRLIYKYNYEGAEYNTMTFNLDTLNTETMYAASTNSYPLMVCIDDIHKEVKETVTGSKTYQWDFMCGGQENAFSNYYIAFAFYINDDGDILGVFEKDTSLNDAMMNLYDNWDGTITGYITTD